MIRTTIKVTGVQPALLKFRQTSTKIRTSGLKRVMKSSSQPMVRATATEAPVDSGALRRSQTVRIKSYRRGAYVLAVVGAKSFKYANGRNPAKYSHLVNKGHRIATGKKILRSGPWRGGIHRVRRMGGRVAGNPFALRAFRSSSSLVQYLFNRSFANEVERAGSG